MTWNKKKAKIIWISANQIQVPDSKFRGIDGANFYPMSIPAVKEEALHLLQFMKPILLVPVVQGGDKKEEQDYRLVGGRRTLQLILEQNPRNIKVQAILLEEKVVDEKSMEIMDLLCSVLLHRPDHETLVLLAASMLEDREFKEVASKFLDVSTVEKISSMLGFTLPTMHRLTAEPRKKMASMAAKAPITKTTLGITEDSILSKHEQ